MSCVRITHIPTSLVVECQETRSQIQNRAIALTKLKAILNQMEFERKKAEKKSTKRLQVGIAKDVTKSELITSHKTELLTIASMKISSISMTL